MLLPLIDKTITIKIIMAASTPAYTSLGYELPFPGSTILDNLEWSILYIADLTDTPYTYLKMGAVNAKLAHLYRTQPNATTQSIADVLTAKAANVETLDGYMGGPDVVREMVLWIDAFLPIAPQYEVHTGVIALFVLFAFISTVSTLARLASRFRTAHVVWSLKISDWFMILGTVLHLFIESMNIACEYPSVASYSRLWFTNCRSQMWFYSVCAVTSLVHDDSRHS